MHSIYRLLAQAKLGDQRNVTVGIPGLEVVQQLAATADHAQQAATAVVILGMQLEVGGQFVDTGGQQSDLNFGAAGIGRAAGVGLDDLGLDGGCNQLDFLKD